MARNPYDSLGDAYDTSIAFDYNLEADQVKRRRQIAELLRAQSMDTGSDGRFISNSAGTWFVPGADSGIAGGISKLAKALISRNMESKADARDKELSEFAEQRYEARLDQLEQARRDREAAAIADAESQQTDGSTPTVTVIPDNTRRTLAAMLKEGGLSANYARQRLAAMDAPPSIEYHDGYLINMQNGKNQRIVDPKLETQVVESDGRKKLVNAQTGETIRDLGSAKTAEASQADTIAAINAHTAFESADASIQGTIDELRGILEKKGGGSVEDTTGAGWDAGKRNVPGTDEYSTKFNIERTLAQKIVGGLKEMKAAGVGTSAFNSDKESERLEKAFGSINWNDEKEARRQLNNLLLDLTSTQERMRKAYEAQQTARGVRTPSSGSGISLSDF